MEQANISDDVIPIPASAEHELQFGTAGGVPAQITKMGKYLNTIMKV